MYFTTYLQYETQYVLCIFVERYFTIGKYLRNYKNKITRFFNYMNVSYKSHILIFSVNAWSH